MGGRQEEATTVVPGWLEGLVEETFFAGCGPHGRKRKNEKNIFCLHCCLSICPHCAPHHPQHPLLQVRRYVYNDVVRLDDLQKLIDCSYVQSYTINSAKVVFLKQRPNTRPFKGSGNICLTCDRLLQEPFHFCSLSCKVDHVVAQGEDISSILYRFDGSDFAFTMDDGNDMIDDGDGQITPNSILEDPMQQYRGCTSNGGGGGGGDRGSLGSEECNEVVKRKKKGSGFFPQIVLSLGSRRKGAPHRSPLS